MPKEANISNLEVAAHSEGDGIACYWPVHVKFSMAIELTKPVSCPGQRLLNLHLYYVDDS